MKGIKMCAECSFYSMQKHKCMNGATDEGEPTARFYADCPLWDVVPVVHGKWIAASNKPGTNIGMKCSLCGARIKYSEFFNGNHNYFHKCGAKMDGGKEVKGGVNDVRRIL